MESTLNLNHVTVTNNTANSDAYGGGEAGGICNIIFMFSSTVNFENSIVAGNTATTSAYYDCRNEYGTFTSLGYNLMGSATGCPNNGTTDVTPASPLSNDLDPTWPITAAPPTPTLCQRAVRRSSKFPMVRVVAMGNWVAVPVSINGVGRVLKEPTKAVINATSALMNMVQH